jgi:hypothetical protein
MTEFPFFSSVGCGRALNFVEDLRRIFYSNDSFLIGERRVLTVHSQTSKSMQSPVKICVWRQERRGTITSSR